MRLADITADDIDDWYATLLPAAPTRRSHTYALLSTVMRSASTGRRALISESPCSAGPRQVPQVMTMPRTVDEILQHADQLAARFDDYEPDPTDGLDPGAVALLRAAIQERSDAERHVLDAIKAARAAGMSWSAIGIFVGTSGEAARQRYGNKVA
ncbi:MAG: hypothetical protein WBC14_01655 [Propionicimonas sp.]